MAKKNPRYTHDELVVIIEMWERGVPVADICKKVGRGIHAIENLLYRMKKSRGVPLTEREGRGPSNKPNWAKLKEICLRVQGEMQKK